MVTLPEDIKQINARGFVDKVRYKTDKGSTLDDICYRSCLRKSEYNEIICLPYNLKNEDTEPLSTYYDRFCEIFYSSGLLHKDIEINTSKISMTVPGKGTGFPYFYRYVALCLYRLFDYRPDYMVKFVLLVNKYPELHFLQPFVFVHSDIKLIGTGHHFSDMPADPNPITGIVVAHFINDGFPPKEIKRITRCNNYFMDRSKDLLGRADKDSSVGSYYGRVAYAKELKDDKDLLSEKLTPFFQQKSEEFDREEFCEIIDELNNE